ncbi:MAG: DUF5123 domain-containing protein [Prolixibacteraceae bacterium]|jgi:hypothetical protein|nr:DUF5123 domain-containing protein [Prolixibacteraceae bacterium]
MKKLYTISMIMLFAISGLMAQNEVVVNVGDDIITKIAEVEEGGTLLIMPGIHKASYASIEVTTSMTIKNNGGINDTRVHIAQIDVPANNISLTIDGIIWSGAAVDSISGVETVSEDELEGDYFLNFISGEAMTYGDILVKNCLMNHFNRSVIRGDRDVYFAKSIKFDNCIVNDLRGGGDYGPFRMKSRITFDNFELTNCTMSNIPNKLIDLQDMDDYPCQINIDHCTFYNWGGGKSGQYLFDIRNNGEAELKITNSILGKTMVEEEVTVNGWRVADEDGNAIKYNEMSFSVMSEDFILDAGTYAEDLFNKAEYNSTIDPSFTDADAGNFQITEGADLYFMSDEGTLVGDPRWANGPVSVHELNSVSMKVFPSITSDVIFIDSEVDSFAKVSIYTATGKEVISLQNVESNKAINVSGLNKGIYLITVANETQHAFRFIKQ